MKALITGAEGQLARELVATVPPGMDTRSVSRAECDITDLATVENELESFRPDVIINTAAYTGVDAAEDDEELAFRTNAVGAENVARTAARMGAKLIHISTDYVFDGARSTPYPPDAPTNPINVYGASKLEGEKLTLRAMPRAVIVRTSWLYSTSGKNFLVSLLKALRSTETLSVVVDQVGCPTSAREFASALWSVSTDSLNGVYHWANLGSASWHDFAREIAQNAQDLDLLEGSGTIQPVTSAEYASRANRPAYSVLDPAKLIDAIRVAPSPWKQALRSDMRRGRTNLLAATV